jgi:hypothetical protein
MSKLHPVEVIWRAFIRSGRLEKSEARHRACLRQVMFAAGYTAVFTGISPTGEFAMPESKQGHAAGIRAAERWLAGCPVRRVTLENNVNGLLGPVVAEGTCRLERIGD